MSDKVVAGTERSVIEAGAEAPTKDLTDSWPPVPQTVRTRHNITEEIEHKRPLSFLELWNMNFGYLGIQFGWGLQGANQAAIYTKLGADADKIPILFLAGPITGLIIQPIIGAMSDRTWSARFGRRRPYFLTGAVVASLVLWLMPSSPAIWVAALLLWLLDAGINVSMEPFRAFVADKLPLRQRSAGFLMQSFFIGLGSSFAYVMPWILHHAGVISEASNGVPLSVLYSFRIGAGVFIAAVLWTCLRTPEDPPIDVAVFEEHKRKTSGAAAAVKEIYHSIMAMPVTMRQLFGVQFMTWFGLSCTWGFFTLAVARNVFATTSSKGPVFDRATEWGGMCMAVSSVVCFLVAPIMPAIANRIGRPKLLAVSLAIGAVGIMCLGLVRSQYGLLPPVALYGIGWAAILAMPYAILSVALPPERNGVYMGLFNLFIVIPQIVYSVGMHPVIKYLFHENPTDMVVLGGISMLIAAALATRVVEVTPVDALEPIIRLSAPAQLGS